jgi:glutamate transport system substrate-binding protein
MPMTPSPRRLLTAFAALLALTATACGGDGGGGGNTGVPGGDPEASADLLKDAPVADDAAILPGSTMERIRERGHLIVAQALDAPLLSQQNPTNPDEVTGLDADLAKLLAVYILGEPNVEVVPPATETREALLGNGTVDVVFNTYTITPERAQQVTFAGPYFSSGLAVAVKTGNNEIKGIDDLGDKTVIVGANTPAVTEVPKRHPDATLLSFGTDPQALIALTQGRGDAYVQDLTLLAAAAKTDPDVTVVGEPFTVEPYGIGLAHGDTRFKEFINGWLREIQAGGQWAKVWQNSLGTVVDGDPPAPPEIGSVPGS